MRKISALILAMISATATAAFAQNTGAQATPQTLGAAPASTGTAAPAAANPAPARGARRGSASGRAGRSATRNNGTAQRSQTTPAPTGNASVGVIGDTDGDGLLDRNNGSNSPALPGIAMLHNNLGIAAGTPIQVRLQQAIDSGHARNGDTVRGVLIAPVGKLPAGAPVNLTVVAAAAAGRVGSSGVLSLQVVSINGEQVLSQVITAEGHEGQKLLPDDAPARGSEAVFTSDQPITLPAA